MDTLNRTNSDISVSGITQISKILLPAETDVNPDRKFLFLFSRNFSLSPTSVELNFFTLRLFKIQCRFSEHG
jgi:hypothetical protein